MLYSKTGNNIIKCLIRNITRKMIFIGFLDEIEGRCLRRDPGLGTWDTDRAGIAGSRGRNRVLGAAFMRTTCRRNARIMNKEKEWARRFYNNMSRSQRTTTKKPKTKPSCRMTHSTWTRHKHHTSVVTRGRTRHSTVGPREAGPAQQWRPCAEGRAASRNGAHVWPAEVSEMRLWNFRPCFFIFCVTFFNENLFFYLSRKKEKGKS